MAEGSCDGHFTGAGNASSTRQSRSAFHFRLGVGYALLYLAASAVFPSRILAGALDQLADLTDKAAQAVVTLKGRDNFNSEYLYYDVSVKNLSSDSLVGESLIIVLDKITNIGGDEWMAGTSESNLTRMEALGQDGETAAPLRKNAHAVHEQLIDERQIDHSRALRETQAQYQPVLDMAPLTIYSCDAEGRD